MKASKRASVSTARSIAGWRAINSSDMLMKPDASSAILDPFLKTPTLSILCDVIDPITHESYSRCPRSLAKRAISYLKSTGLADTAYFGPEAEFFIFDSIQYCEEPQQLVLPGRLRRGRLEQPAHRGGRQQGLQAADQGRLLRGRTRSIS